MKTYANLSGHSGVLAYRPGTDFIQVMFQGGAIYTYNYHITGKKHVDKMKQLAIAGQGLATYISQHVADKYV